MSLAGARRPWALVIEKPGNPSEEQGAGAVGGPTPVPGSTGAPIFSSQSQAASGAPGQAPDGADRMGVAAGQKGSEAVQQVSFSTTGGIGSAGAGMPVVIATGVDTLEVSIMGWPASRALREELKARKAKLKGVGRGKGERDPDVARVEIGAEVLTLSPSGAGWFQFSLSNEALDLRINDTGATTKKTVTMFVSVRSKTLWSDGLDAVAVRVQQLFGAAAAHGSPGPIKTPTMRRVQLSRVDLATDFTGWTPKHADFCFSRVVTRSRTRGDWAKNNTRDSQGRRVRIEKVVLDDEHLVYSQNNRVTSFNFGKRAIRVRVYDKDEETKVNGKAWFDDVWQTHARARGVELARNRVAKEKHVWRCEFQLRRKILVELGVASLEELLVAENRTGLWAYCSKGKAETKNEPAAAPWFSLRLPDNENSARRTVDPRWAALADATFGPGPAAALDRDRTRSPKVRQLVAMIAGCMSKVVALARRTITCADGGGSTRVDATRTWQAMFGRDSGLTIAMRERAGPLDKRWVIDKLDLDARVRAAEEAPVAVPFLERAVIAYYVDRASHEERGELIDVVTGEVVPSRRELVLNYLAHALGRRVTDHARELAQLGFATSVDEAHVELGIALPEPGEVADADEPPWDPAPTPPVAPAGEEPAAPDPQGRLWPERPS